MEPIIQTEHLSHIYSAGTPFEHGALVDVDFTAYRGEYLGIIGHTGSGKSTLIQHLNGLLKPTSGRVLYEGQDIWESKERTRETRFHVGLAQFVGLREELLDKSPFELSGGQKRRVAIAGVIAMEPSVLILDEPTAGLDPVGVEEILGNIRDYHQAKNATIIIVSHSMEEMARTVDRIVVVNDGRIPFSGAPREVFAHGDELEAMGLGVPAMTRVFHRLRAMGVDIDASVYTTEQARDAILARLGRAAVPASDEGGAV